MSSPSTASILERGENVPRLDTAEKLASALNLSPCMLAFGIEPLCEPGAGLRCAGLPERLAAARTARELSRLELGQLSSTSDTLVRLTETGTTMPNLAKLEALAQALGVSPCWLAYGIGPREAVTRRGRLATPADVATS